MNLEISNKNLYLLLPGKVSAVSSLYAHEHKCDIYQAMHKFYKSNTYKTLEDENSKYWHLGTVALYELWQSETNNFTIS
ncbi:MAG: hypothetical protein Q4C30_07965 [Bacteroidia bacterium]|nr:hypothetical protein [Bacteroidia bacterium]